MGRPCQTTKKGATQCHEGLEEIDVLLHLTFKSIYAMRSNGYTNEEEPKSYTSPTVESNLKPKSDPFVISIGSPESDGKERYPMSSGDRD